MDKVQLDRMTNGKGFIAALDQSGGSTPKALKLYGIDESAYQNEDEMFTLVHEMRTRIITSPSFSSELILAAILFQRTMDSQIDGLFSADYLWQKKGILPLLKIDNGLAEEQDGVQLMKPMPDLDTLLAKAKERHIFGTKMRSVIKKADAKGIQAIIAQQFEYALQIATAGLVPIIEPEVDIFSPDKQESEKLLLAEINKHLAALPTDTKVMLKLSLPTVDNFYYDLTKNPNVVRVVALSGGYSRQEANKILARNKGVIASFSRAFTEGLSVSQTKAQFDAQLLENATAIYEASIT